MKKINHSFIDSLNYAIEGVIVACKLERNMKIHLIVTIIVLFTALFLRLTATNFIFLSFAIALVWITELLNSAIEKAVDLTIGTKYHDLAKKAKDIAAGAVFIAAVNSVVVGYLIFSEHLKSKGDSVLMLLKASYGNLTVFILVLISVLVIAIKTFLNKGTPVQGGMPSGHSALAFSVVAIVLDISPNIGIKVLTLFLAILVAQSRVKNGIHTFLEVLFGAILGFGVSYFILFIL